MVKDEAGAIDILFANAGVGEFAALGEITEDHFDKIFAINVRGTLFTVQKALPLLKDGGSIILTGSTAGWTGISALSVYRAPAKLQSGTSRAAGYLTWRPGRFASTCFRPARPLPPGNALTTSEDAHKEMINSRKRPRRWAVLVTPTR